MVTIAVIGSGPVGRTLAGAWAKAGQQVVIGSRDPGSVSPPAGTAVTRTADAIGASQVVVYAIPGDAMAGVLAAHASSLAGRIVIDTTNNFASWQGAREMSAIGHLPPGAAGFRSFNSVGWENMAEPVVDGVAADMVFAGPDGSQRDVVAGLIGDVGFRPVYVGAGPDAFAAVDSLTGLWFALALGRGHGRHLGFRVLTDSGSA